MTYISMRLIRPEKKSGLRSKYCCCCCCCCNIWDVFLSQMNCNNRNHNTKHSKQIQRELIFSRAILRQSLNFQYYLSILP